MTGPMVLAVSAVASAVLIAAGAFLLLPAAGLITGGVLGLAGTYTAAYLRARGPAR